MNLLYLTKFSCKQKDISRNEYFSLSQLDKHLMAKGLSKTVGCSPNDRFTFACKRCVLSLEHVWKWNVPQENKTTLIKQHFCIIGATRLSSEHKSEVAYARLLNIVISYKRLGNNFIFSVIFLLVLFKANKFKESLSGLKRHQRRF